MSDDLELLREYARRNVEPAFATLVSRYINLVYSVALRQVGDPHLAEDITQAVFILLARKAESLNANTVLPGWLCRTARYVSADALKARRRRQLREQEAHMQSVLHQSGSESETGSQIMPLLDAGLEHLGRKDHDAVVLRFLNGKSMSEVGTALGASEDAAKVRVNRALEKLRKFFHRHGVVSTAATIAGTISANSVQAAPAALAKAVTVVAVGKGAMASVSAGTLATETFRMITVAKTKIVLAGVVIAGALAVLLIQHDAQSRLRADAESLRQQIVQLKTDNLNLSERIAAAGNNPPPLSDAEFSELLQLRGQVSALRRQLSEQQKSRNPGLARMSPVYPNAPRLSQALAAARAQGNAGAVTLPADFHVRLQYANLFQKLNLSGDQIAAFIRIMQDKQSAITAVRTEHTSGREGPAISTAAIQEQLRPIGEDADSRIRQLLGDANYSYYQAYSDQHKERAVVMGGFRDGLDAAGVAPLTLDEDEQLVNLVYQARMAANNDAAVQAREIPQIMQEAATFLTPEQVTVLERYTKSLVSPPVTAVGGVRASFQQPGH